VNKRAEITVCHQACCAVYTKAGHTAQFNEIVMTTHNEDNLCQAMQTSWVIKITDIKMQHTFRQI